MPNLKSLIANLYISLFCTLLIVVSFLSIFYLDNFDEFTLNEILRSIFELIILISFLYLILGLINKKITQFIPFGVILILQYWNIYELFPESFSKEILLIIVFCFWILIIIFLWRKSIYDLKNINIVFTSVIILGNIFEISAKFSNVYNSSNFTNPIFLEKSYEDIEFNLQI